MIPRKLEIREIEDADVSAVVGVWIESGISRPWNDPLVDIAFARKSPQCSVLVGLTDGQIVATTMVGEDGHHGWVYYVATHPDMQRMGFARQLMDAAEVWLRHRGIWKMQLLIRSDNSAARGFYKRLGYGDTGAVCFQKVISGDMGAGDAR
jgi:ribosomal protein S18 acetylase RimI-like enzyme